MHIYHARVGSSHIYGTETTEATPTELKHILKLKRIQELKLSPVPPKTLCQATGETLPRPPNGWHAATGYGIAPL